MKSKWRLVLLATAMVVLFSLVLSTCDMSFITGGGDNSSADDGGDTGGGDTVTLVGDTIIARDALQSDLTASGLSSTDM